VGFLVDKVALGQVFFPSTSVSPCKIHSTSGLLLGKRKKKLNIFITGLHNKPQGCVASVASAAGPFIKKFSDIWQASLKGTSAYLKAFIDTTQ
jgi:hypothetical protein